MIHISQLYKLAEKGEFSIEFVSRSGERILAKRCICTSFHSGGRTMNIKFCDSREERKIRRLSIIKFNDQEAFDSTMDPVNESFENNDINGFFIEQMTDLKTFYNVFPEIILTKDKKLIVQLRSKESVFSQWGKIEPKKGYITRH